MEIFFSSSACLQSQFSCAFSDKEGTLLPLLLESRPFAVGHFHLGMEKRNTKPVNLGEEESREVIARNIPVQTPYFIMLSLLGWFLFWIVLIFYSRM